MKWRIWGVSGNKLLLISEGAADYIKLKGANGYNNAVKILNDACSTVFGNASAYGSGAIKARSINMEDIDKVTNMTTDAQRKAVNSSYGTTKTPVYNNYYPKIYAQEPSKSGGGTLARSAQSSWYEGSVSGSSTGKETFYGYEIASKATQTIYRELASGNVSVSYWIASRSVSYYNEMIWFGIFMMGSRSSYRTG